MTMVLGSLGWFWSGLMKQYHFYDARWGAGFTVIPVGVHLDLLIFCQSRASDGLGQYGAASGDIHSGRTSRRLNEEGFDIWVVGN